MGGDGSRVGLDVHATSAVACLIDEATGKLRALRVAHRTPELIGWLSSLPAPVQVAHEAGPTGFGPARA